MTMVEILLDVAWKSTVILGVTLVLLHLLHQRSAAQRAWIAHIALIATLFLPLAVTLLPRWEVAAAAPVAEIARPVAAFFEAPAVIDVPAMVPPMVEETPPAAASPTIAPVAQSPLSNLLSVLSEPATLAGILYGVPAALLLLVMLVAVGRLFALRARALVLVEPSWLTALAQAQRRMNFKHGTALLLSDEIRSPVSWGVLRPVILLNAETMAQNNDAEAIIAHELAHVARLDWASLLLARVATALFWFNPLAWMVARQAHQLREEAADDAVLRSNVNNLDYAALLVGAARHESHGFLLAANGVAPSRGSLQQRITRVLDERQLRAPAYLGWMSVCVLGAVVVAAPLAAFSATTPQAFAAPRTVAASVPAQVAQALPVPPIPPVPRAPQAAPEPPLPPTGDWNEIREQAQELAEREREKAQELAERERERAERMVERELDREHEQAERDGERVAGAQERVETKVKVKAGASVTIDVPGVFIQASPQGATIRAPGVNIQADANGTVGAGQRSGAQAGAGAASGVGMKMARATMAARSSTDKPSADELIQMSVLGIDGRYRDEIAQAGYPGLSTTQLRQFRIHNVRGAWLRELAALGYSGLTHKQITNMAIHNVSADFVRRAIQHTAAKPTPEQLTQMRILGIRPDTPPGARD